MAIRTLTYQTCDRCLRVIKEASTVEGQPNELERVEFNIEINGEKVAQFHDLCPSCAEVVEKLVDRILRRKSVSADSVAGLQVPEEALEEEEIPEDEVPLSPEDELAYRAASAEDEKVLRPELTKQDDDVCKAEETDSSASGSPEDKALEAEACTQAGAIDNGLPASSY